ncbi:MAG: hypothetical protein R2867_18325 [Caldilineaceae bacterium]
MVTLLLLVQHSRAAAPAGLYAAPGVGCSCWDGLSARRYTAAWHRVTLWRLVDGVRTERYAVTTTDNGGTYQFVGIPSGTYYLTFYVPHQCYVEQWYAEGTKRAEADALIVNGNLLTNLNVTLTTGACITGVIRLDGKSRHVKGWSRSITKTMAGIISLITPPLTQMAVITVMRCRPILIAFVRKQIIRGLNAATGAITPVRLPTSQ